MTSRLQPIKGRSAFRCPLGSRVVGVRTHNVARAALAVQPDQPRQPTEGFFQLAAAAVTNVCTKAFASVSEWAQQQAAVVHEFSKDEEKRAAGKRWWQHARTLAMVIPLASAAAAGDQDAFLLLTKSVCQFVKLYLLLLFVRVILTWFPTFNWDVQPWLALRQVTDPYLNLFQGLVPPLLGAIDLTPLVGFMLLQLLAGYLDTTDDGIDMYW